VLTRCRIYQLEKNIYRPQAQVTDAENSPLVSSIDDLDQVFQRALDVELEKVVSFYQIKEREIYSEVSDLLREREAFEEENQAQVEDHETRPGTSSRPAPGLFRSFTGNRRSSIISQLGIDDSEEDEEDETAALNKPRPATGDRSRSLPFNTSLSQDGAEDMRASTDLSKSIRRHSLAYDDYVNEAFSALYSYGITLKKRAISLYVQLCELKSYAQLNKTGFAKVLKKYDKICERNLKSRYIDRFVTPAYPFLSTTVKHIDENIQRMEMAYAAVVTQGDVAEAKKELRLHLREHVVWERNTVWREMIGIERKAQAANMGLRRTLLGADSDMGMALLQGDDEATTVMKELRTPVGRVSCPTWLLSPTLFMLIAIIAVFFTLLYVPIFKKVEEQNCLAMLVFVSLLWATEVGDLTHGKKIINVSRLYPYSLHLF
jgi:phosphate transporter